MFQLQELVRLHRQGHSVRRKSALLAMGRNTVRRYECVLGAAGLLDGAADELPTEEALRAVVDAALPPSPGAQEVSSVAAWEGRIAEMALRRGAGPRAIHDALRAEEPAFSGSYDAVKRLVRRLRARRPPAPEDVAIPVSTPPGAEAQVDFGYVGELFDPATARRRKAWVFVMVLSHSRHLFADLVFDQRAETWQRLHAAAFSSFGGVPASIRPDNLKAAVVRAAFAVGEEPEFNQGYVELARYYDFQIDPCPPRDPRKKGKVERAVQYIKRNFIGPRDFEDIEDARRRLAVWVTETAGARRHGTTGQVPLEVFAAVERPALRVLPVLPFAPVQWRRCKVHADSHVQVDGALYSVPWRLLGQQVRVRVQGETVEVRTDQGRVATHARVAAGRRSTLAGHLPEGRSELVIRDRTYWEARAAKMGDEVLRLVATVFDADHIQLQLRRVQGLVTTLEREQPERARAAAARALHFGSFGVGALKDMLRKGLESTPLPDALLPAHGALAAPRFARAPAHFKPAQAEA